MNGARQAWLVAQREIRERGRSRGLWVSVLVTVIVVVAMIVVPDLIGQDSSREVGLAGSAPAGLSATVESQGSAAGITVRMHRYAGPGPGEAAVRRGDIAVLIVDATRLEWRHQPDQQLRAVLTSAIQLVTVRERAAAAGVAPGTVQALLAPVPIANTELGSVTGRTSGDETAALVMTVLLLVTITTFGGLVLSGVIEEKTSRVIEVLLVRLPARSLLVGKVAGIGLLGLAQIAVTAVAALIAAAFVRPVDVPAIRASVLAWLVVWFLLGYALYAMLYGALGSLASRAEDAQNAAGPVTMVLLASYFVSFLTIGRPDSGLAKVISYFPTSAPMGMPNRLAMGAAAWWEPAVAAGLALAVIAVLVQFGGRVYANAILHAGPAMKLRDAWRGTSPPSSRTRAGAPHAEGRQPVASAVTPAEQGRTGKPRQTRLAAVTLLAAGIGLGVAVGLLTRDTVIGVAAGAGCYALADRLMKAWSGHHRHLPQ